MGSCGYIISPGYPVSYDPTQKCSWLITVSENAFIELTFEDFDIFEDQSPACDRDFIDVWDILDSESNVLIGRFCNTYLPLGGVVHSSWNKLKLDFFTDGSQSGKGFMAKYTQIVSDVSETPTWEQNTNGINNNKCVLYYILQNCLLLFVTYTYCQYICILNNYSHNFTIFICLHILLQNRSI